MSDRIEFLQFARRIHNALTHAIRDGDGRTDDKWLLVEKPRFAHHASAVYLNGALGYLEGAYGKRSWANPGTASDNFDTFVEEFPRDSFRRHGISSSTLDAMVCIRNAVIHNGSDLALIRDSDSLVKMRAAPFPGVDLSGTIVTLISNDDVDFMEQVRQAFLAVSMYHGDG